MIPGLGRSENLGSKSLDHFVFDETYVDLGIPHDLRLKNPIYIYIYIYDTVCDPMIPTTHYIPSLPKTWPFMAHEIYLLMVFPQH